MKAERNPAVLAIVLAFGMPAFLTASAGAAVIYVDDDAHGLKNGSSWADAYNYLQDALADANTSLEPVEVRVAQGTYRPDQDTLHPDGTRDRDAAFRLISGMTLAGGYGGLSEPDPNARNVALYETTLSGDLAANDLDVNDPCDLVAEPTRAENSCHVVTASGIDTTAVLDGFTITGGNADHPITWPSDHRSHGGGLYVAKQCNVKVLNCKSTANSAQKGGAVFYDHGAQVLLDCMFTNNAAQRSAGAIHDGWSSSATVTDCEFNHNWAPEGGAVGSEGSKTVFTRCTFCANSAGLRGGAIYNALSDPTARNCLFTGNLAKNGGAIYNYEESEPILLNCTFSGNAAPYDPNDESGGDGGAINNWEGGRAKISNCIFWANTPDQLGGQHTGVKRSCIEGWTGGSNGGNIADDPCFIDPGYWSTKWVWVNGDYHLKSQAGRFDPNARTWLVDDVTSPCIDAGDMLSPIGLEPFPNGGIVNMGAYGGTAEASKSYFGDPVCETIVAGDVNGDCNVNFDDFRIMAMHWLRENE